MSTPNFSLSTLLAKYSSQRVNSSNGDESEKE